MPWDQVMDKWKHGGLHSGSKSGPKVKSRKQAIAIMLSEKRAAQSGKSEYASKKKGMSRSAFRKAVKVQSVRG
jgi:hypothetical protein